MLMGDGVAEVMVMVMAVVVGVVVAAAFLWQQGRRRRPCAHQPASRGAEPQSFRDVASFAHGGGGTPPGGSPRPKLTQAVPAERGGEVE